MKKRDFATYTTHTQDNMSGILDSKTRIFDTIITDEGRSQISTGKLRVEFVSFSDMNAIYALDTIVSGGPDFTGRLCFEATNMPQDQITLEADDSGRLLGSFTDSNNLQYKVSSGQIFSGSVVGTTRTIVSSSQFASLAGAMLSSSINNFQNLYVLGSPDPFDTRHDQFVIGPTATEFSITKDKPVSSRDIQTISVDHAESIFFDERMSHVPNFQFLPPVNKPRPGETVGTLLGHYVNLNQKPMLNYDAIDLEAQKAEASGYAQRITFLETSRNNNLFSQFFEVGADGVMTKLDVIDFGTFPPNQDGISRHVFFVGKVFTDGFGATTFINLFSLIWE